MTTPEPPRRPGLRTDRAPPRSEGTTRHTLPRCDRGVSSVVSAVLLFALFSTAFLLWSVTTLPEWIADREHEHFNEARAALADLQNDLDRLSSQGIAGPAASHVPLSAPSVPLLQRVPSQSLLEVGGTTHIQGSFTNGQLLVVDGVLRGSPSATAAGAGPTEVDRFDVFQLEFTGTGVNNQNQAARMDVAVSDGTGTVTARIQLAGENENGVAGGCGIEFSVVVTNADGSTRRTLLFCGLSSDFSSPVNLMEPRYGFVSALLSLQPGKSVTFSSDDQGADSSGLYMAMWRDGDGNVRVAGTGAVGGYNLDLESTTLRFVPQHRELMERTLTWEGGALIAAQSDGQAVVTEPGFELVATGDTGLLRWTLVALAGDGSLQGQGIATTRVTHTATQSLLLTADSAAITIASDHAAAWHAMLCDHIAASGTGDATCGLSGDSAALDLLTGDITTWIIELRILHARVTVL